MLESIPQYKSISETNKIYSQKFKKNSLNNLIFNLKNIKIFHPKTILDKLNEEDLKVKKLNDIKNKNNYELIDFLDNLKLNIIQIIIQFIKKFMHVALLH